MAQIRPEEHSGVGAVKQYKLWERSVCPTECFHDLSDSGLAVLIAGQVKGTAKDALDIVEINGIMGSCGLELVCRILE